MRTTPPVEASGGDGPRILVVGAGAFQLEILRAAKQAGEVVVVDGSPSAPGLALADHPRVVNFADTEAVVRIARELDVRAVVTAASDAAVPATSAVAEALGLPGLAPVVAERCRDKLRCFEVATAAAQRVPQTRAIDSVKEALAAVRELGGYPVVVKPRSGGGGRGVSIARSDAQLTAAVARARGHYGSGGRGVLVQQLIGGRSVGVEAFFVRGALAAAFVLDDQLEADYVSPVGHSLPPTLDPASLERVTHAVAGFAGALGLRDGPCNFDLRQAGEEVFLIEVNPRLGGNSITDLVRASYGIDLASAAVHAALGRDPAPLLERRQEQAAAARLILKRGHGTARLHDPKARWEAHPDLLALDLTVSEGQPAQVHIDDLTLLGRVMVRGDDSERAVRLAKEIADDLRERIELE